jgi:hypothetical protein
VTLKTLSSRATNDGKLFTRIANGRPISVVTLETCFDYLANGDNWPAKLVPGDVLQTLAMLGAEVGVSAAGRRFASDAVASGQAAAAVAG